jgi:glycosyltransferase involved in cell wall biosynthesis
MNLSSQLTVIIPVHNGEKYLEETLHSVFATQDFTKSEIIVVNDGSWDTTGEILRRYNSRIECINQKNQGQSVAINNALKKASTTFCSIVNCDDPLLNPNIFNISINKLNKNYSVIATYPNWRMIDSKGTFIEDIEVLEYSREELIGNFNCMVGPGAVFSLKHALMIGGWNPRLRYLPDYDFWLRMSNLGDFLKINQCLATWRHHADSISVKSKGLEMAQERINVMEDFLNSARIEGSLRKKAKSSSLYSAALLSFDDRRVNGRKLFIKSIINNPAILKKKSLKSVLYLLGYPLSAHLKKVILTLKLHS